MRFPRKFSPFVPALILAAAGLWLQTAPAAPPAPQAAAVDFAKDVYPVFEKSCVGCHGEKQQMGRLRLDSKAAAAKVLQPGNALESELYKRVAGIGDQARMPMGGELPAHQIAAIKAWIEQGAIWPDGLGE